MPDPDLATRRRIVHPALSTLLQNSPLSLDSLFLIVALFPMTFRWDWYVAAHDHALPVSAIGFFAVSAYLLGVAYLLVDYFAEAKGQVYRLVLVGLLVTNLVVAPTLTSMAVRKLSGEDYRWAHDTPIQVEAAVNALVRGANPYAVDYVDTPLARWPYYTGPTWSNRPDETPPPEARINPAVYHVAYLPFALLVALPFQAVSTALFGWFDARIVFLAAYLWALWLITRLVREPTARLCALILVGLNPLLVPFVVEGRSDILVFSLLLTAVVAWRGRRVGWAGVFLGLAIATKHVALLFVPFYALLFIDDRLPWRRSVAAMVRPLLPVALTVAAPVLPFLIWDWRAFIEDTVSYIGGSIPTSYPLSGMGIGGMAVTLGWVPNAGSPFPNLVLQALFAGPLLIALLWRQRRVNTMPVALTGYALFLMVFMWLARFYFDNYLGYILLFLSVAAFWPRDEGGANDTPT